MSLYPNAKVCADSIGSNVWTSMAHIRRRTIGHMWSVLKVKNRFEQCSTIRHCFRFSQPTAVSATWGFSRVLETKGWLLLGLIHLSQVAIERGLSYLRIRGFYTLDWMMMLDELRIIVWKHNIHVSRQDIVLSYCFYRLPGLVFWFRRISLGSDRSGMTSPSIAELSERCSAYSAHPRQKRISTKSDQLGSASRD